MVVEVARAHACIREGVGGGGVRTTSDERREVFRCFVSEL